MSNVDTLIEQADALLDQHRMPEAKQLYAEAARLAPDNADAWLMLGLIEQEQKNPALAETHLRRAIELDGEYAMAHLNLANLLRAQNRLAEARQHAQLAARFDDTYLEAWMLLGMLEMASQAYAQAEQAWQQALRLAPNNAECQANLGRCQAVAGKLDAATASLERALALGAATVDNHLALARLRLQLQQPPAAVRHAQAARDLAPDRQDVQLVLANALIADGQAGAALPILEALSATPTANAETFFARGCAHHALNDIRAAHVWYQKACAANPDHLRYQVNVAHTASQLGRYDEVIEHSRRALGMNPDHMEANILLADSLYMTGQFQEAIDRYRTLLARDPGNVEVIGGLLDIYEKNADSEAYQTLLSSLPAGMPGEYPRIGLAVAKTYAQQKRNEEALALLERHRSALDSPQQGVSPNVRMGIHNLLGKLLDKKGEYAGAFAQFQAANRVHPCTFEAQAHVAEVDRIIDGWSAADFAAAPTCDVGSRQPLFIVGMPRSGTTLAEQILSSHPLVTGGGELQPIPQLAQQMSGIQGGLPFAAPRCLDLVLPQLEAAARLYADHLREIDPEARHVTDKNTYNFPHVGLIALLFPQAKIVHTFRTPLDTCLSIYFQMFGGPRGFANDLDAIGAVYTQYQRLMAHWHALLPGRIFDLSYESLVDDQEGVTRALLDFCGLPWDERCLDFHANERTAMTASYNQVRQRLYRSSVDRWKHYEKEIAANSRLFEYFSDAPGN